MSSRAVHQMVGWWLALCLSSSLALAQEGYALPQFSPPPPPPPPPQTPSAAPSPPPMPMPDPLELPAPVPAPTRPATGADRFSAPAHLPKPAIELPPHWYPLSAGLGLLALGGRNVFLGMEGWIFGVLGRPNIVGRATNGLREVSGAVFLPGVEGSYGTFGGAICLGPGFCASRWSLGPVFKAGWGRGQAKADGSSSLHLLFYGQLSAMGGFAQVPTAPLAPGDSWGELVLRARAGVQWADWGVVLVRVPVSVYLVLEVVPLGKYSQGVMAGGGLSLGL